MLVILILLCTPHLVIADKPAREITKSSTKRFDVALEIKAFYSHLVSTDPTVKKQFESLTASSRDKNGGIFHVFDPQIVEWFPRESHWDVSRGFDSDGRYLAIQPVGFGRGRAAGHDMAVVAEFRVTLAGTTKYDDADERAGAAPTMLSNTLTIRFLGFRSFDISGIKQPR